MVQEQVRGRLDELSNRRAFDALRVDGGCGRRPTRDVFCASSTRTPGS